MTEDMKSMIKVFSEVLKEVEESHKKEIEKMTWETHLLNKYLAERDEMANEIEQAERNVLNVIEDVFNDEFIQSCIENGHFTEKEYKLFQLTHKIRLVVDEI